MIARGANQRIIAVVLVGMLAVFAGSGCSEYEKLRKGIEELSNPDGGPPPLTDEQKIQLIDSMRSKGSFEAAREHLTGTAKVIAERIAVAVPGQTWKFDEDSSYGQDTYRNGSQCEKLSADIARRPEAKPVDFGSTFSAEDFTTAASIVRQEAAEYGATTESSLFNESAKREYDVQGRAMSSA